MIITEKNRLKISKYLFHEGVCYAKKDYNLAKHPDIDVPNLQVIKLMKSFKTKEYVRETFAWMHYYWYLTNDGIEFLRTYLNLPSDIVPSTLKRSARPLSRPMGGPPGDRPRGPPRFEGDRPRFGDRDGYRAGPRRPPGEFSGKKGRAPADYQPAFMRKMDESSSIMCVDTGPEGFFVFDSSRGIKKFRQEDENEEILNFERKRRGHRENMTFYVAELLNPSEYLLSNDFVVNPPEIARLLEFSVRIKKRGMVAIVDKIKNGINWKQFEEIGKHTRDLAEIVSTDPRMVDELDYDLLIHLVQFLEYTQYPEIQTQAIIILQTFITYSSNNQRVIECIKDSVLVNLICSEDYEVKYQAMLLLRTMALKIPVPQFNKTLEVVLEPLTLLIDDDSIVYEISDTLAVVCEVYPMLPCAKFDMVINSFLKLFEYESKNIPPHACLGLSYLCDGRKEMVVGKRDIEPLIDRLIEIIKLYTNPDNWNKVISALVALGTIVRWGTDEDIEVIIVKKDALQILGRLLQTEDKELVGNACWIISNITAGKENHVMAVITSGLIECLFDVVENYKLLDVKKEAAWAISNAIHGVCTDQIKSSSSRWLEPFWAILKAFRADQQIVSFCLEGLVNLGGVKVSCNGQPINTAEFKELLVRLRGARFLSAADTKGLLRLKKPPYAYYIRRSDDSMDIIFHVTCTFKEDVQQSDSRICLVYRGLEEDALSVLLQSSNIADDMEVEQPDSFYCY